MAKTTYKILREDKVAEQPHQFAVVGQAAGYNPQGAVSEFLSRSSDHPWAGDYIAVPVRSWRTVEAVERHVRAVRLK